MASADDGPFTLAELGEQLVEVSLAANRIFAVTTDPDVATLASMIERLADVTRQIALYEPW